MNLLAFDTSTDTLSIAVVRGAAQWLHSSPGGAQASATLLPAISRLMAEAGLALGDLDAIAFGRGPGSFTGLRTACAVAQGLAFGAGGGRGVPVLPIDTLAAVAEAARLCAPEALQVPPGWSVVGNAQAAYGERLAPGAQHLHALPDASALLRLAPALLAAGGAVPAAEALPRYVRNKVAKTTQERADERAAAALASPQA